MSADATLSGHWPLVGRDAELSACSLALQRTGVRAFMIHGPLGIGKTRLAEECRRVAESLGHVTARAAPTRGGMGMPLSSLAHLLPSGDGSDDWLDPVLLFDRARRAVSERSGDRRLVLVVDDLPAIDATSAVLLGQLVEQDLVFLIATVRSGEPVPDTAAALWVPDRSVRVDLAGVERADVDAILESVLDAPLTTAGLAQFWEACGGNPLFLHELMLGAAADGALVNDAGVYRLTRPLTSPPRLRELVDQRIRSVEGSGRVVLELLALCQPVGLDDLDDIADPSLLEKLEKAGLIEVTVRRRRHYVWLGHAVYGDALRAELPRLRQRSLLLNHAARIEGYGARRHEDPLRIASWRLTATGTGDPDLLIRGARLARHALDFQQVERLARAAYAQQPSIEAGLLLLDSLLQSTQFAEAESVLAEIGVMAQTPEQFHQIAVARTIARSRGLQDLAVALATIDEARAQLPDDMTGELIALRALVLATSGRPALALATLAEFPLDASPIPLRNLAESWSLSMSGLPERAVAMADAGRAAALTGHNLAFLHPTMYLIARAICLREAGRLSESMSGLTEALDRAIADDIGYATSFCLTHMGLVMLIQGKPGTAMRWCRDAASIARSRGIEPGLPLALTGIAIAAGYRADAAAAETALAELSALTVPAPAGLIARAHAWTEAARGHLAAAREHLIKAADGMEPRGERTVEVSLLFDVARLGAPEAVADRLTSLAARCEGPLVSTRARYATGAAAGDPALLDQAAGDFERIGALLFAAEAAAGAASLWRGAGELRRAAAAAARATALAGKCEGARTPALAGTTSAVALTAREREISFLAAGGLSSKAIAEREYLSVRTVNNHLQSAYVKLGVSGRHELAGALKLVA